MGIVESGKWEGERGGVAAEDRREGIDGSDSGASERYGYVYRVFLSF